MKTVHWTVSIGFPTATRSGKLEFYDDATDEEIEEAVQDAVNNYLDIGWEVEG